MQLSLDPRDAASVEKAAEMLGLNKQVSTGNEESQRQHIERLQDALNKKRDEIAKLKAAAMDAPAAQAEPAPTGPVPPDPMVALAYGVLYGTEHDLLKVPAIGRGAITKMREWARTAHPEAMELGEAGSEEPEDIDIPEPEPKEDPEQESPTQSGGEEKSYGGDTSDEFDEFDDMLNEGGVATKDEEAPTEEPEEPASEEKTYTHEDCRDTLREFNKTPGKTILQAKAILKEHGFSTVDDIPAAKIGTIIKALNKGMRE